ncbi:hypothetical protein L210DRAFT_3626470 [Boletus edulis BED1]|uniref:Uncharacterized protein n=1 Tax=Boletus edulis BED1 TaxID=1328754 RepID=A0AAD4GLX4_BOLED|nr:hypothetical protein L210DRAFT_3626470 [Boletus edulis BED1]
MMRVVSDSGRRPVIPEIDSEVPRPHVNSEGKLNSPLTRMRINKSDRESEKKKDKSVQESRELRCLRTSDISATTSSLVLPALLVLACFSAPASIPIPVPRSSLPLGPERANPTFPPALAAHAPPGKSGSRPRPKSAPIHSLSRPSAPSRPPPLVGLAYRAMSKDKV